MPADQRDAKSWTAISATGSGTQNWRVKDPAGSYAHKQATLSVDKDGRLVLSMNTRTIPARSTLPLVGVESIRVHTVPLPVPKPAAAVRLSLPGGETVEVSEAELRALPRVRRLGGHERIKGWKLGDLVSSKLDTQPFTKVEASNGDYDPLVVDAESLDSPTSVALLKRNKKGELILRVWDLSGDAPAILHERRNVNLLAVQ